MQELTGSDFERVKPLFDPIPYHRPAIFTVLEGTQPGRVFVDRASDPSAVLIISDFCYVSGSPETLDLQADVIDLLEGEVMSKQDYLLLFPFSEPWQAALQTILQPYQPKWYERNTYDFDYQRFRDL